MLEKLKTHLNQNFPFLKGKKLLIAASGGIDSMVLIELFHQLKFDFGVAHCNFQLRGKESDLDEKFTEKIAKDYQYQFHSIRFLTHDYCKKNKVNTQIGARALRYGWFQETKEEYNYDYILTGHHLNDVMETFLINLSRGTGIEGLAGIPPINNDIIRPLLVFSRADIESFAKNSNTKWREDQSNAETKYLRNKIRHHITPELYKLHPNFESNFLNTLVKIHESKDFIKQKITALQKNLFKTNEKDFTIDKTLVKSLSDYEIYEVFKPFGFTSPHEINKLISTQTGKQIHSSTHTLLNNREVLILSLINHEIDIKNKYTIKNLEDTSHLPISLHFTESAREINKNCVAIDINKIRLPLTVRKRKDGDYFYPTGMKGKKKISKFFKDEKHSLRDKEKAWLLCSQKEEVIWIIGQRADRKLTETSKKENLVFAYLNAPLPKG